jgi:hypothetical protein
LAVTIGHAGAALIVAAYLAVGAVIGACAVARNRVAGALLTFFSRTAISGIPALLTLIVDAEFALFAVFVLFA